MEDYVEHVDYVERRTRRL